MDGRASEKVTVRFSLFLHPFILFRFLTIFFFCIFPTISIGGYGVLGIYDEDINEKGLEGDGGTEGRNQVLHTMHYSFFIPRVWVME